MKANDKQKPLGTKHKVREEKEKAKRLAVVLTVTILTAVIVVSGFALYFVLNPSQTFITGEPKAAIVDQGSLSPTAGPNPYFIENVTNTLNQSGYAVDYYSGEKVTVDFYRNLPTHGYSIIILRVHSAPLIRDGEEIPLINLFTSEPYSTSSHFSEQLNDELVKAVYYEGSPEYFAIPPSFIKNRMQGTFNNATIIMMGCDGLKYPSTAQAFIEKGAKAYISWNGPVSATHTDQATMNLLQHLLIQNQTIKESINQTLNETGYDPTYFTQLKYYPPNAGNQAITNTTNKH